MLECVDMMFKAKSRRVKGRGNGVEGWEEAGGKRGGRLREWERVNMVLWHSRVEV